jgi:cyanoexosortase A
MRFLSNFLTKSRDSRNLQVSLMGLGLLALIHFSIDFALNKQSHLMMSLLMWSAIMLLLWDKQEHDARTTKLSAFLGFATLSALLIVSIARPNEKTIGFYPLIAFSGWFLIFVNFRQIERYLKEFVVLLGFGVPKLVPETAFGLASLTAKFSAFTLHYFVSYPVKLIDNIRIQIPNGSVDVIPACSGISLIVHMLSVCIIFLCLFPVQKRHFFFLPLLAVAIGFVLNGVRVAVLAALSAPESASSFHYWHSANGASLFVLAALILYGAIWFYFFKPTS